LQYPRTPPHPLRLPQWAPPLLPLRCSTCKQRTPHHLDNVYGDNRPPTDIIRGINTQWQGQYTLRLPYEGSLRDLEDSSCGISQPPPPATSESEGKVSNALLSTYVEQGGVEIQSLLLSKAITPDSEPLLNIPSMNYREWSFKDILHMPIVQQKEWKLTCQQELDSLHAHNVY
jgi:hypothetical protein